MPGHEARSFELVVLPIPEADRRRHQPITKRFRHVRDNETGVDTTAEKRSERYFAFQPGMHRRPKLLIDRLEQQELVVRAQSPTDRRSHALQLSPKGARMIEELAARVRRHEDRIAAALSTRERSRLIALLKKIS